MTKDPSGDENSLDREIAQLEQRLRQLKANRPASLKSSKEDEKVRGAQVASPPSLATETKPTAAPQTQPPHSLSADNASTLHTLLLISDSALPLGSFAFSSGLESYLAHHPRSPSPSLSNKPTPQSFPHFLALSLSSLASTTLPYLRTAHTSPHLLPDLDNDLDASTSCTVARRASIAQGRALVAVWERSLRAHYIDTSTSTDPCNVSARDALETFASSLKSHAAAADEEIEVWAPNGHLPPLMGVVCRVLGIELEYAMYVFLLNHAKTVVSAGVRAGVLGPYQAQGILAGAGLKVRVWGLVEEDLRARGGIEEAGQSVPCLDLWGGRHEIIYSRIFNS